MLNLEFSQRNGLGIEWTCYCLLQLIRKDIIIQLLSWTACDGNETFHHGFLLLQSFASCFLFAWGSVTRGILEEKTLSLTAAVCMTELRRWTWTLPLSSLQSFQANVHWSSPVLQSTTNIRRCRECAGGGGWRWHAAVGTVGGNCFPGIC